MNSGGSSAQLGQSAQQQQTANVGSAIATARLNNTNQVTPYGNLTYTETGGSNDNQGNWIPSFTATQTLSPEQQQIYNKTTGLQSQALDIGKGVLGNVDRSVTNGLNYDGLSELPQNQQALKDSAYNQLMTRTRTDLGRASDAEDTQMANQGIAQGSEAWNRAKEGQGRALTDASVQASINAGNIASQDLNQAQTIRNQGINERTALHNQPLQDYSAMMGFGGTTQSPQFVNTPQTQVQAADFQTPALAQYQAQQQSQNSMMGGLFGLGGSALMAGGMFL